MKKVLFLLILLIGCSGVALAQFDDPFKVSISLNSETKPLPTLSVAFTVPTDSYLYKDMISAKADKDVLLSPIYIPDGKHKYDETLQKETVVYVHDAVLTYGVKGVTDKSIVTVGYQGCTGGLCYMPQTKSFNIISGDEVDAIVLASSEVEENSTNIDEKDWRSIADRFKVIGSASGYRDSEEFVEFLNKSDYAVKDGAGKSSAEGLGDHGLWLTILLILVGGMALNLTPCVLPMIPINIAIIGAGAQSGSRARGFLLGGVYGAGIAFVYGLLGLVVILTGAKFGSLNSLPAFNFAIALLFVVLALSMFGLFNIDFTKFQGKIGNTPKESGGLLPSFLMGGVAALLAGACVAPVVISVLLLSTNLYQSGHIVALLLPFVLGIGMALPWPFAGGGLSFLPKPGAWMERIKQVFGVIIIIAAIYYALIGYRLIKNSNHENDFVEMLKVAEQDERPVLIDFWATWCKNCHKMEKTTLNDPKVKHALNDLFLIKYQAEDMNDPEVKAVLDYYKVIGLPTYVKLRIKEKKE